MVPCTPFMNMQKRQQTRSSAASGGRRAAPASPAASPPKVACVVTKAMKKAQAQPAARSESAAAASKAATRSSSRPLKPPKPLYCLCRSSDIARFMIACDNCQEWFHGDCVSVTAGMAERILAYYCDACRRRNRRLAVRYKSDGAPPAAGLTAVVSVSLPVAAADSVDAKQLLLRRQRRPTRKAQQLLEERQEEEGKERRQRDREAVEEAAAEFGIEPPKRARTLPAGPKQADAPEPAATALNGGSSADARQRRRQRLQQPPPVMTAQSSTRGLDISSDDSEVESEAAAMARNGADLMASPPLSLSSPTAAAAAVISSGGHDDIGVEDDDDDDGESAAAGAAGLGAAPVGGSAEDDMVEDEMLLPAEDESATDDELETSGFRPPHLESDAEQDQNSLLDEDDFASTSVFRFPKRCGYCEACRLKSDCGRCEICQAKKRYPSFKLDSVDCLTRQCRTMARLGGRLGSLPFPIQKRGRGRPSKASLSNEYFLYLSAGARPRRREDQPEAGQPRAASAAAAEVGRKRRLLQHQQHSHRPADIGAGATDELIMMQAARPQFCTPYALSYPDHSYCKHHAAGGWRRNSPQPVSRPPSPPDPAHHHQHQAGALTAGDSPPFGQHLQHLTMQQHHQRYGFMQPADLPPHHQHQQAFYTLNDDTDNLEVTWPEEAAA